MTKLVMTNKYYLYLFETREDAYVAHDTLGAGRTPGCFYPNEHVRFGQAYNMTIRYTNPGVPILLLEPENRMAYQKVLYDNQVGWIIREPWYRWRPVKATK